MPSQLPPCPSCEQHDYGCGCGAISQAGTEARDDNCPGKGGGCSDFRKVLYLGDGKSDHPSWKGKYESPIIAIS